MERIYLNDLFDLYQKLLNEHEQSVFIEYYQEDLSLKEIADNFNVTRNAIYKTLKSVEEKLNVYEKKLELYKKKNELLKAIENNDIIKIKKIVS